jgi:hypothetical protein
MIRMPSVGLHVLHAAAHAHLSGGMAFGQSLDIVETRKTQVQASKTYTTGPVGEADFKVVDPPVAKAIYAIFEVSICHIAALTCSLSQSGRQFPP